MTRRYCHLGTGNYNPDTARFYTDLSLLTSDPQIGERVHMIFNYLTAHAEVDDYSPLLVAPLTMAESFLGLIRARTGARAGRKTGAHCGQDERTAGAFNHSGALPGLAGRA